MSTEEQRSFGWIKDHQTIVLELSEVFETTEKILKIIKNEGLSYKTIAICLEISAQKQKEAPPTVVELLKNIDSHLGGEKQKLPDADTTWNASSDIIESLFGTYKSRKAANPKYGVTPFILFQAELR